MIDKNKRRSFRKLLSCLRDDAGHQRNGKGFVSSTASCESIPFLATIHPRCTQCAKSLWNEFVTVQSVVKSKVKSENIRVEIRV